MTKTLSLFLACSFTAGMTSGCIDLKPPLDTTRYFVLGSAESAMSGEGSVVELGTIVVARYLDTPYIVTRMGANEVSYSETQRWGEDLTANITRVVSSYLTAQENVGLATTRHIGEGSPDYVVDVRVERFEGLLPDAARFVAHWIVRDGETKALVAEGETVRDTSGWIPDDYADLAAKLDASLRVMAEEIAAAL